MTRFNSRAARAGAALLSAVLLLGAAACDDDTAPLFEVPGTGAVEGFLFFDANNDGLFDPSAGDSALSNVNLRLLERGTTSTIAGSETQTNASGRFQLSGVRVGSHDLAIDTAGIGSGVFFCQNPIPVNVFLRETQFRDVAARGGCVITIAAAEAMSLGTPVTLRGTLTAVPGQINSGTGFIQDATGGISLFRFISPPDIQVGDVVELSGTLGAFNAELQVVDVRVTSVTPGDPPAPKVLTTAAVAVAGPDAKAPDQGRLIQVVAAKLLTPFAAGGGRNATIDDGSGPTAVRIESGLSAIDAINPRFTVGNCYTMTGLLRAFNGTAQLTPRTFADIQEVPCQG